MTIHRGRMPWQTENKFVINLNGPDGNAMVLLSYASRLGRDLGFTREQKEEVHKEMTSGDYEHLVETFEKHFGAHVDLYR